MDTQPYMYLVEEYSHTHAIWPLTHASIPIVYVALYDLTFVKFLVHVMFDTESLLYRRFFKVNLTWDSAE